MAGFKLNIRTNALYNKTVLDTVASKLNKRQLLEAIGLRWLKWITDNITAGGTLTNWPNMSINTIAVNPQRPSARHPSSRYTSRLKQSFTSAVDANQVKVGTDDPYSVFMDEGTKPHKIFPRNAKRLRFKVASGNTPVNIGGRAKKGQSETVFALSVNHPGTPPRPLLPTKAVAEYLAVGVMTAYIDKLVAEVVQKVPKK